MSPFQIKFFNNSPEKRQCVQIDKDVLNLPYGEIRSIIIKVQHNCTSDRKAYGKLEDFPIKNEYCIIFKKAVEKVQPLPKHEQYLN